jgi:hypothetical protein
MFLPTFVFGMISIAEYVLKHFFKKGDRANERKRRT